MSKKVSFLWPAAAVLLSAAGLAFSLWLTIANFNLIWLILSPVIIAFYQSPAVLIYRIWKRGRRISGESSAPPHQ
ncbi:MAG: hypothetical protein A2Y69_12090 [Candidatus Aminicenantes bacterium RBG_13_59_9]|nr:MAG: hypothetical protein A2Y69_12090 [Candidatus Aminicenantes bacterium RBG_13_59_9]